MSSGAADYMGGDNHPHHADSYVPALDCAFDWRRPLHPMRHSFPQPSTPTHVWFTQHTTLPVWIAGWDLDLSPDSYLPSRGEEGPWATFLVPKCIYPIPSTTHTGCVD